MTVSPVLDAAGRRRSPATMPGYHAGRPPRNKGQRYPADPPTVEEIIAVMRQTSDDRHGFRLRALIVVLWRGGLRIQEALALGERDLDPRRGSLLVRNGKGGRRREIGMDAWGWEQLRPWLGRPGRAAGRAAVLRHRRPDPRAALVERQRPRRVPPARRPGGYPAPLRAAPAAPCPRRRARPRGRAAQRDPAPARPRQPRHDQHLPAGHRHRRDHRHRPRQARADDVRHRRPAALSNPKRRQRGHRNCSRCPPEPATASRTDAIVSRTRPRLSPAPGPRPLREPGRSRRERPASVRQRERCLERGSSPSTTASSVRACSASWHSAAGGGVPRAAVAARR